MKKKTKMIGNPKDSKICIDKKGSHYYGIDEINITKYPTSKAIKFEFIVDGDKHTYRLTEETILELANNMLDIIKD